MRREGGIIGKSREDFWGVNDSLPSGESRAKAGQMGLSWVERGGLGASVFPGLGIRTRSTLGLAEIHSLGPGLRANPPITIVGHWNSLIIAPQ